MRYTAACTVILGACGAWFAAACSGSVEVTSSGTDAAHSPDATDGAIDPADAGRAEDAAIATDVSEIQPCIEQVVPVDVADDTGGFCSLTIPALPEPWELRPDYVNVAVDTDAGETTLVYVSSTDQCAEVAALGSGGWFYDDRNAPTTIVFCPEACQMIGAVGDGMVRIKHACPGPWLPP